MADGSSGFSVGFTKGSCFNAKLLGPMPILDHFMVKNPPPPINQERVGQGQVNYLEEFYSIVRANCESAEPTARRTKMILPESL
jgi:hypothetical protein